ncbi:thiamine pyrophosphate-binding protein [Streptomyces sp. NE06-03E]|uniref:Thiamine pyrophosphate-binding protein n=1 Tax=Streptomyces sp. gb1(2016) TaxID=1828321 RepID=A0A652LCC6_9ACTN|nr:MULTISPECIES: thiamine pyrophosphate-binding protein [unclassified Streptomyces]WSS60107.1 thiamine pyrophosphate-binding protein [Streptomyces sp. NBC_01177]MDX3054547.1 thiamine pyrophosphate-binding protein [Streptomyces sp. NE06-03E]MDX3428443.1 thiamine pyrophosphate-binding protein [Streptomyces sp. ME01-18a]RPK37057.1 Acetolactate synthase isozyme 2 large subunit [Streptomyces sp. ADI93-02]TXS33675.1 thiamine pyrophosphate-binding protein [Streptomyces sp. gb1(2016)]
MRHDNGGDLLVTVLRELGIDTVFGIVSVHNLPLVEAVDRELRFVPVRHEASAVNAADAYGRARGTLGCALTSTGTGAGNAAGSLIEALSAGSSVLHVTGQVESEFLGGGRGFIHETKDQLGMLRAVSAYAASVPDATQAGRILREAARSALTAPGGPASVEWPIDLQYTAQTDEPAEHAEAAPAAPTESELTAAGALLASARRPLVWAGGGANTARGELARLLEATGAGLITSNSGRGSVPEDHEQVIGNFATTPAVRSLLADADVLLTVGTHFRSNETADYTLELPGAHLQIDIEPAALGRVYPATHALHGDAAATLTALLPHARTAEPGWTERVTSVRTEVRANLHDAIGPQAAICDAIRAALPREAVVARDVTIPSSSWGNRLLEMYDPKDNVFPRGGGIGQGLGMGIGAALARPGAPTVVIAGDGGLAVHLGELLTLAQERPRLTLIVFNDGGYGVLRNMQDRHSERRSGVDLTTPDFGLLARACGLPYARISAEEHAAAVLTEAIASDGPTLVEVDLEALGPMKNPFTPPVRIPGQ